MKSVPVTPVPVFVSSRWNHCPSAPPDPFHFTEIVQMLKLIRAFQDRVLYSRFEVLYTFATNVTGKRIVGQAMDQVQRLFHIFILSSLFLPLPKEEPLALVVWAYCFSYSVYIDNIEITILLTSMFGVFKLAVECIWVSGGVQCIRVHTLPPVLCIWFWQLELWSGRPVLAPGCGDLLVVTLEFFLINSTVSNYFCKCIIFLHLFLTRCELTLWLISRVCVLQEYVSF